MLWTWISNKYFLSLVALISVIAIAFNQGASWQQNKCQAKFAAQREALLQQLQHEQTRANQAATRYETEKANRTQAAQVITKEVTRVIQKPVYQSCRIDADGLRLLESAIHQANRARKFDHTLPVNTESTGQ